MSGALVSSRASPSLSIDPFGAKRKMDFQPSSQVTKRLRAEETISGGNHHNTRDPGYVEAPIRQVLQQAPSTSSNAATTAITEGTPLWQPTPAKAKGKQNEFMSSFSVRSIKFVPTSKSTTAKGGFSPANVQHRRSTSPTQIPTLPSPSPASEVPTALALLAQSAEVEALLQLSSTTPTTQRTAKVDSANTKNPIVSNIPTTPKYSSATSSSREQKVNCPPLANPITMFGTVLGHSYPHPSSEYVCLSY